MSSRHYFVSLFFFSPKTLPLFYYLFFNFFFLHLCILPACYKLPPDSNYHHSQLVPPETLQEQ